MGSEGVAIGSSPLSSLMINMPFIQDYWPMVALLLWFGYKWWSARRVMALLPKLKGEGGILLDVRSQAEFASGNAPGTRNIPLNVLGRHLGSIPKTFPVVVGCASGTRSGMAKLMLKKKGYQRVYNIGAWRNFMS
jgi:phage shock protein E